MADDPEAERIQSLDSMAERQDRIEAKLDQLLAGGHKQAEAREEQHLDRPSTVQEQVRAELARADAERKAQADAEAEKSEQQSMREQLAKLTEAKPVQPQPRRQRWVWGKP
jgi:hypothetical protein